MGLRHIVDAFSVHEKHQRYSLKSLDEAISLVSSCNGMQILNLSDGPEGSISTVTTESINILLWGLRRLKENVETYQYHKTNLLSCMTLTVENLHSTVNKKQSIQTLVHTLDRFLQLSKNLSKQWHNIACITKS